MPKKTRVAEQLHAVDAIQERIRQFMALGMALTDDGEVEPTPDYPAPTIDPCEENGVEKTLEDYVGDLRDMATKLNSVIVRFGFFKLLKLMDIFVHHVANHELAEAKGMWGELKVELKCFDGKLTYIVPDIESQSRRHSKNAASRADIQIENKVTNTDAAMDLVAAIPSMNFPKAKTRVSRACRKGLLLSTGYGKTRRIDPVSLRTWIAGELADESRNVPVPVTLRRK